MSDTELLAALVRETNRIANALEAIASVQAPAPSITRPMADWANAREILERLGAEVVAEDKSGPTRAQYQGRIYVRRSAHDEDGEKSDAIWFSSVLSGNVKDGNVKWGRLLTFRNRKTDALPNGAKKLKVDAPEQKSQDAEKSHVQAQHQPSQKAPVATKQAGKATPAPSTPPVKKIWGGTIIKAVIEAKLASDGMGAAAMLDRSQALDPLQPVALILDWAHAYNEAARHGNDPDQAAFLADAAANMAKRDGGQNGH